MIDPYIVIHNESRSICHSCVSIFFPRSKICDLWEKEFVPCWKRNPSTSPHDKKTKNVFVWLTEKVALLACQSLRLERLTAVCSQSMEIFITRIPAYKQAIIAIAAGRTFSARGKTCRPLVGWRCPRQLTCGWTNAYTSHLQRPKK